MQSTDPEIINLRDKVVGEIFNAIGFSKYGLAYKSLGWLFNKAADRLAGICINADRMIAEDGFDKACAWILTNWCSVVTGRGTREIPHTGPLLVISNHAGTYDTFVIISQVGRDDIKPIASDVPFLKNLPNANAHIIFLSDNLQDRTNAARAGINHLQGGHALLLYGTGLIDPDPAVYPNPESWIEKWLPSIDLFLRAAPNTKVVISIVSGVVSKQWAQHPITWFKRVEWQKRRMAEFGQVIQQLYRPGSFYLQPYISLADPVGRDELLRESGCERVLPAVIARGKALLADHIRWTNSMSKA